TRSGNVWTLQNVWPADLRLNCSSQLNHNSDLLIDGPVESTKNLMYPHRIRLRGPWQATPVSSAGETMTIRMPCRLDEVWPEFGGTARLIRPFGIPRQLDDFERIWLTFAGMTGQADVLLNGKSLGHWSAAPFEVEVTGRLLARSELCVDLHSAEPGGGLWGE